MTETLTILQGGYAAVQDLGRRGHSRFGLPVNGAADQYSAAVANVLVGSAAGAPLIEITLLDFAAAASRDTIIAVTGAPAEVTLNGQPVPQWQPLLVRAGQTIAVSRIRAGLRVYLAVQGELCVPTLAGSVAPDSILGFGHTLASGTTIPLAGPAPQPIRGYRWGPFVPPEYLKVTVPSISDDIEVAITDGPDAAEFDDPWSLLTSQAYTITPQSNHVGLRLAGSTPERSHAGEVLSRGVPVGAVEVPAPGELLVLHRGRGVTAGYPVLAVATTTSLNILGQARPGHQVRFRRQTLAQAVAGQRMQAAAINSLARRTTTLFPHLSEALNKSSTHRGV
jgi:biotin-dependent carboxylase-like uncharacterized protein